MIPGYLFVDGYNVINAWPQLQESGNLEHRVTLHICIIFQGVL